MTKEIKITYRGQIITLECDLTQASAPLVVDGEDIGMQTADACHRSDQAVLIAAKHVWPHGKWPAKPFGGTPVDEEKQDNAEWKSLEYETVRARPRG